jgi:hypothetical protein
MVFNIVIGNVIRDLMNVNMIANVAIMDTGIINAAIAYNASPESYPP